MTRIQMRRGTAAQWTAANPVLASGEPGFETDTGKEKIGNGSAAWSALPYVTDTLGVNAVAKGDLVVNVKDYGAVGDGVAADRAAILAAITATDVAGGGTVYFPAGTYKIATPLAFSSVTDITLRGGSRETSIISCAQGFLNVDTSSDRWTISDLNIQCSTATNTFNGIEVDYPRRWDVHHCRFQGFGGVSLLYKGGIQSRAAWNYFIAKDSSSTNGAAGLKVTVSSGAVVATTITSERNYVGSGKSYGYLWDHATNSCSVGDIAELVNPGVGMRLDTSDVRVVDLYTESITGNPFEMFDSPGVVEGRLRDEPVVTWTNVAVADRRIVRLDRYQVNPGRGIIYGGSTAATDLTTSPSIRWGTGSPESAQTGVIGSLWLRTDGSSGTVLYRKETGTGNTGWVASQSGALDVDSVEAAMRNASTDRVFTIPRETMTASNTAVAGTCYVGCFTPLKALTISKISLVSGTGWTTPTLIRFGLYTINTANNAATLVAATLNDTSAMTVTNTLYQKALDSGGGLPTTYSLVAGQRYGVGFLGVGGTPGQFRGNTPVAAVQSRGLLLAGTLGTGLSDLPTSGTLSATNLVLFAELLT